MDYSTLASLIPSAVQAGTGVAQAIKGQQMGAGLTDPIYKIPQSAMDALTTYRTQAGRLTPAGYDAFVNQLSNIQAGANASINRGATSAPQALGATLNAVGAQTKALQDYQGFAERDYQSRQQQLADALNTMAGYEQRKWQNDVYDPFMRKSTAASSLVGAGMQNAYAGLSDVAGVYANKQAAKEERAYQEKRDTEKLRMYLDAMKDAPMNLATTTETGSGNLDAAAIKSLQEYIGKGFENYGDAYSSSPEAAIVPDVPDYTPRSNRSQFYTPY